MTDDIKSTLDAWEAPPPTEAARRRIDALFADPSLSGPLPPTRARARWLPAAYAIALAVLLFGWMPRPPTAGTPSPRHDVSAGTSVVNTAPGADDAPTTAIAVSTLDLQGFEPIDQPRIRITGRTP